MDTIEESANAMLGNVAERELDAANLSAEQLGAVRRVIARRGRAIAISKFMTKQQSLLAANSKRLPQETQKRWADGRMRFYDPVKYVRKVVTSLGGRIEIFTDDLDKIPGITNISKGKLNEGEALNLGRIELMVDTQAGIDEKTADLAPISTSEDNAILNGEVELVIGGMVVVAIPANRFTHPEPGESNSAANGFNLKAPIPISDKDDIQIYLVTPKGNAISATATVIEFALIGAGVKPKA